MSLLPKDIMICQTEKTQAIQRQQQCAPKPNHIDPSVHYIIINFDNPTSNQST